MLYFIINNHIVKDKFYNVEFVCMNLKLNLITKDKIYGNKSS